MKEFKTLIIIQSAVVIAWFVLLYYMDGCDVIETLEEKVTYYNVQTTAETGTILYINTI